MCWMIYSGEAFATTWFFIVALVGVFFSELSLVLLPARVTLKCQRLAFMINGLERETATAAEGTQSQGDQRSPSTGTQQRNVNMRTAVQLINLRQVGEG